MLREDFGPGDSTEIWNHLNLITEGLNQVGQTARYWFGGGQGANPDKHVSAHFAHNVNVAPDLNIAGKVFTRATTMANPPQRAVGGRRLVFVEGGPHRVVWRPNWDVTSRGGAIWAGIQLNPSDAGANDIGALTGVNLVEKWYPAAPYVLPGTPGDPSAGITAEVSIDYDFEPGDSIMLATRNETNGIVGLRFFELWTMAQITRIGH